MLSRFQHFHLQIKTTKPKNYSVNPSYGGLEPGEEIPITLTLHRKAKDKSNDKFLIQIVETQNIHTLDWKNVKKENIAEFKLTAKFEISSAITPSKNDPVPQFFFASELKESKDVLLGESFKTVNPINSAIKASTMGFLADTQLKESPTLSTRKSMKYEKEEEQEYFQRNSKILEELKANERRIVKSY